MARLSSLFLAALAIITPNLTTATSSHVKDLTPSTFDEVVLSGTPGLVEFYAPWCGHCKNLAPTYETLASAFAHAPTKVHISRVDADAERKLGQRFGVQGFPTLKWFDGKSEVPEEYNGGRDLESLSAFVSEKSGVRAKGVKKGAPSLVRVLDDKSFGEVVGGEKDVLVAFTAPWCGHCKRLTPTYDSLASTFAREPTVVIAKVDCEHPSSQRVAADQNIQGFPTIKFFPRGSSDAIDYSGARSEEAFVRFLNEHAGTHRQAGGSLDEQGGVVEALDHVLEKYTGENIEDIIDDLKEAAGAAPGKYGAYYVKVAEKVRANKEYVKKESERLGKILGKGGLAGEKLDDLVSRSNILRRFVPKQIIGEDDDAEVEEEVVKGEQIRDEL